jgi:hypothetical protein
MPFMPPGAVNGCEWLAWLNSPVALKVLHQLILRAAWCINVIPMVL